MFLVLRGLSLRSSWIGGAMSHHCNYFLQLIEQDPQGCLIQWLWYRLGIHTQTQYREKYPSAERKKEVRDDRRNKSSVPASADQLLTQRFNSEFQKVNELSNPLRVLFLLALEQYCVVMANALRTWSSIPLSSSSTDPAEPRAGARVHILCRRWGLYRLALKANIRYTARPPSYSKVSSRSMGKKGQDDS